MLGKGDGIVGTKMEVAAEDNLNIAAQIESSQPVFRLCMHVEVACPRMDKFYPVKG